MRILWRALPDLALPLALGLALAYLGTGFVPRPAPSLRPPGDLRAQGVGYAEESPVRAILERNVLGLETTVFDPLGALPRPEQPPAAEAPAAPAGPAPLQRAPASPQPGFAPLEPAVKPAPVAGGSGVGATSATEPLSGGHSVQGRIQPPGPPAQSSVQPSVPASTPASGQGAQPAPQPATQADAPPAQPSVPRPAPQAVQPAQPAAAPSLSGIRLVGVIAGGTKPLAMLSVDGQAVSLEVGGQVRGWTLQSVEPGLVVLRSGEHVRRLALGQGPKAP